MAYQSFEELEVWRRGCRLAVDVNQALVESRNYALKDQMCRAAISIPSNIAEGHERDSRPDFVRFLRIAKGSVAELRTRCYLALKLEVIAKADAERFIQECRELSAMLQGLIRSLIPAEN
ncbi:MAG TPA: four helix bundle protein [Lacipirellulaceae bacterium]|nr:four helix bundle protein [Verrucomicrobiota bacterium]HMO83847.1 four helix bundle protein [Lacipirellulaceae bacterium]